MMVTCFVKSNIIRIALIFESDMSLPHSHLANLHKYIVLIMSVSRINLPCTPWSLFEMQVSTSKVFNKQMLSYIILEKKFIGLNYIVQCIYSKKILINNYIKLNSSVFLCPWCTCWSWSVERKVIILAF